MKKMCPSDEQNSEIRPGVFDSVLDCSLQVGVVTTFGNKFWEVLYVGDPGRRIISRGLRPFFHPECTLLWKGLYNVEKCKPEVRTAFLEDIKRSYRDF